MSHLSIAPLDDATLVERMRSGDRHAFETMYARYQPELLRHAERVLGGRRAVAEDVVQESLWRAHRALTTTDRDVVLQPWLHRIVHNRAVDELRKREVVSLEDRAERLEAHDDLEAMAELREDVHEVLADVVALPPRQRDAVVSHIFGGQGHAEMAGRLGVSVGASKSLLNRARTTLIRAHEDRLAA